MTADSLDALCKTVTTTPRLRLRTYRDSDLAPFAALNADPLVMKYLGGPWSEAQSVEMAHGATSCFLTKGYGKIAVERISDGAFLGFCGLSREHWYPDDLEIGWRIAPHYWGHGYATEAAIAWRDYAFDVLSLPRIISITDVPNMRSIAVMERIGMRRDHLAVLEDDGVPFEAVIYAMTAAHRGH